VSRVPGGTLLEGLSSELTIMAQCIRCGRTLSGFTFGKKICSWCKQHEAAQRGEGSEYQPVMATPWNRREALPMLVTQAIFGLNVAVFVGMLLSGVSPMSPTGANLLAWGANYGAYTLTGQWWRLLTSCFVHIGIIHIAFNMWCLWSLGELAERLYGRVTFACVYLLCGISGSLGSVLWHSTPTISAGASGAIFGIAGAVIASLKLGKFSSSGLAQGTMQSLMFFVGYNVIFGAISGRTDNACHAGGLLAGLLLGALIAKVAPEPRMMPRLGIFALVAAVLIGGAYELQRRRAYPYYVMRASEQLENGKIDAAIPLLEAALRLRPGSDVVHYELARAYWEKKNFAGAERELQKVLQMDPKDEEVAFELGGIRLNQHRLGDARQTFEQLLTMNPQSAEARMGFGAVAFEEGDCTQALKEYGQAAELNPRLSGVYASQGKCLMRLKHYDDAIVAFRKEIEVSGDTAATERSLSEAYKAKGMTEEADAAMQQTEKLTAHGNQE
jgi:membrane associated rhomboid family serine protease/Tfp pilus assembly protein PilF